MIPSPESPKAPEPVITGETSDGYHTFNELYEHRHALFALACHFMGGWKSKLHADGTMFPDWFIAGLETGDGMATYHLPMRLWDRFPGKKLEMAPEWDGHTANDVIGRFWGHLAKLPAPEPPVPVDLDDIQDAIETCEDLNQEYQHAIKDSPQEAKAMEGLKRARLAIGKAFEDLRIENKALRSRLSEVEGVQDAISAIQEEKDHWQAQADRMADPGKSTAGAYYLGIVKGLEKARGFLPAEGTAKPSQDPKPSLTPSVQGGDTREAVAKHIRKTRFFNEDQEARAPKWEDLPKDFKDIFYGEADKILSLIQPSLTDAGQEDALQSLGNLLDFIDLKKDELLGLCENPGRLEECIDAARSLIEPQHPGEAK